MLAERSVEMRGGREFIVGEVSVKFSSEDAQQSRAGRQRPWGTQEGYAGAARQMAAGPPSGSYCCCFLLVLTDL